MTNEEKAFELSSMCKYGFSVEKSNAAYNAALEMAEWKDEQMAEAKSLLRECYNTILGITALDCPEDIAKARKYHNSSLIKRIELFMYKNQSL